MPDILFCLHDNLKLHIELDEVYGEHCANADESHSATDCCGIESNCSDFKITGGTLILSIISNTQTFEWPAFECLRTKLKFAGKDIFTEIQGFQLAVRDTPDLPQPLTDIHIPKIVIRV